MKALHQDVPSSVPSAPVARLVGHEGPVQAVCFTGDGKYCLTAGHDRTVRLWNPARMDPAYPSFATTRASNSSASTIRHKDEDIKLASLPHALPIHSFVDGHTHAVSAIDIQDTSLIAASNKTLVWTDVITQKVLCRYQGVHTGRINAVAISDQCQTFLTASYDATVCIWDARSRATNRPIQILKDAKDSVTGVHTVQSSSSSLAGSSSQQKQQAIIRSCSVDGTVRTYDLRKGLLQCDSTNSPVGSMALTHDGQCLALSCLDGTIRLMEVTSGELLQTYANHHVAGNYALECTITADDAHVVTGSEDGRAVLYDLVRGLAVQELCTVANKPTCAVAAHPTRQDASVVIAASYDGNVIVWANSDANYIQWQD